MKKFFELLSKYFGVMAVVFLLYDRLLQDVGELLPDRLSLFCLKFEMPMFLS